MRTRPSPVRSLSAVLACAVLTLTGCSSPADPVEHLRTGQVVDVPVTAITDGSRVEVGLPSGVLTLRLAPGLESVSTQEAELVPSADVSMIGVTWSFAPHPSSDARDVLLEGQDPQDLPQPTVSLVDGSRKIAVPVSAQAGQSGGVVVGVTDPLGVEVTYDGVTQTVDLDSAVVGAGQAEGLIDLGEATTTLRRACPASDFPPRATLENGCRVEAVSRLPYVAGLGWAPDARTWLVVDARIDGDATMLVGGDPGTVLDSAPPEVHRVAFAVAGSTLPSVDFDFGSPIGSVSVPLGQ